MKTLVCPHCNTTVPDRAGVCSGCGAEIVRGLTRRERSIVGLAFIALAVLIATLSFRAYEIAQGHPFLRSPRAQDGLFVIAAFLGLVVVPYVIGKRLARFFWPSRVRFFRSYQHQ